MKTKLVAATAAGAVLEGLVQKFLQVESIVSP